MNPLVDYKYKLPKGSVAIHPLPKREDSRMLVLHKKTGEIQHRMFKDILEYFNDGDSFVHNDTRVINTRMVGIKEGNNESVDLFLAREIDSDHRIWDVFIYNPTQVRRENIIRFNDVLSCEVLENTSKKGRTVRMIFKGTQAEYKAELNRIAQAAIPKYVNRDLTEEDKVRIQSVYGLYDGSIHSADASLHFDEIMMKRLELFGIRSSFITAHVGFATIRPITLTNILKHRPDSEEYYISGQAAEAVNESISTKSNVCAVGFSTMKALESSVSPYNKVRPQGAWTDKLIYGDYRFRIVKSLLTDLHPPCSTPLITACAFGGKDNVMKAYTEAVNEGYRFFAYGDTMLII